MARVAGIVLAAGFSRRLGQPKQLVNLCGKPALQYVLNAARQAPLEPLIVVLSPQIAVAGSGLDTTGFSVVINERAHEGQSSSVKAGLAALPQTSMRSSSCSVTNHFSIRRSSIDWSPASNAPTHRLFAPGTSTARVILCLSPARFSPNSAPSTATWALGLFWLPTLRRSSNARSWSLLARLISIRRRMSNALVGVVRNELFTDDTQSFG